MNSFFQRQKNFIQLLHKEMSLCKSMCNIFAEMIAKCNLILSLVELFITVFYIKITETIIE